MADIQVFQQKSFIPAEETCVFHGFFGRQGGFSGGEFAELNCGPGSGEDMGIVEKNRALVAQQAGVKPEYLLSVHQVHGADCVTVQAPWPLAERPKVDAMVTDRVGFALGVLTADCAPVLFWAQKSDGSPVIGAAHAGWKGALGGVLGQTAKAMEGLGARLETLRCCVGPCIAQASYEVGVDFVEAFLEEHDESGRFFQGAQKSGHLMFDLSGYCAWRLFRDGVKSIALMDRDTYALEADFFSYRRATHRAQKDYGRQISVIAIREG